jgi:hypothetical protein
MVSRKTRDRMPEASKPRSGDATTALRATRRMSVIAQDPSVRRRDGRILMAQIDVPAEDLIPGPIGYRLQLVDYDASTGRYRGAHALPAELEDEPKAWADGDPKIVGDFRFHAQNAYALVMKTLARFEFALGRRVGWSFDVHQLKVAPNGIMDANAFYSRADEGLVFGYFPGRGGRTIHTCLSHDIVVHETTHALLDALRERYLDPSGPDQAAFHEGYADVIALLSVFSQVELVAELLRRGPGRGDSLGDAQLSAAALRDTALFGLAEQMGEEMSAVRGDALRRSARIKPGKGWLADPEFEEPHRRGEILVAAVMNGFLEAWTGRLQAAKVEGQERHSLLRVAEEGADIAGALVTMWIRAIDYMPPVHLHFGDALSAAITADMEARPDDGRFALRGHMLASFAAYGIAPASTREDAPGAWRHEPARMRYDRVRFESMRTDKDEVFRFLWDNRDDKRLNLRMGAYTEVLSVRPCLRVGVDGFTLHETVAEYFQVARLTAAELRQKGIRLPAGYVAELERLRAEKQRSREASLGAAGEDAEPQEEPDTDPVTPVYGGGVLIFDEYGKLKYHVHNDVFGSRQSARFAYLWRVGQLRAEAEGARFSTERFSALHRSRAIGARRIPAERW